MIVFTIFAGVLFLITIISFPFVSMVDYIVHGELTNDYVMKLTDWLNDITDKFKPE
jgi:hypothetical protein